MDFKGETPTEAAEKLAEFFQNLAKEKGEAFELHRATVGNRIGITAQTFRVAVTFSGPIASRLKQKNNRETRFGEGHIETATSTTLLKLIGDEEGFYRWHRIAGKHGLTHPRPVTGAFWFPLVSDFIAELLATEPSTKAASNVLPMK